LKKKIAVIGVGEELDGFRLGGVSEAYDARTEGLMEKLKGLDAVFLVTVEAAKTLGPGLDELRKRTLVQELPSEGYMRVREIIRGTVGVELR